MIIMPTDNMELKVNFENMVTKDEEVSVVEVNKDEKLNVETVYVGFNINKKEEQK